MPYIGQSPSQVAFLTDTFSGNGSTTAFTMSVAPANTASVLVAVSGVLQDPSTYSVSGLTLTFSAAPPTGTSNISARYLGIPASGVTTTAYRTQTEFTATAGQTTFTPPSYTVGFISVYRNGVLLGSADYTATNGTTVVLTTGATAGDLITTQSFYVSSVLNAIPATAGSVGSTYLAVGAVGSAQLGNLTTLPVSGGATFTLPTTSGTGALTNQVVGQGQTTQLLTGSRTLGTTYTNSTTNTIVVYASILNSVASPITLCSINSTSIQGSAVPTANAYYSVVLIVPPSATYVVNMNGTPTLQQWVETR